MSNENNNIDDIEQDFPQPRFESMTADNWMTYLRRNPDRCLVVNAEDGVHTFEYEEMDEEVTFFAHGSRGYDKDGTRAALESVAGQSEGLKVQTHAETYHPQNTGGEQV